MGGGGGGFDSTKIFKGISWERAGDFFKEEGVAIKIIRKVKSEIFNDKKSL